MPVVIGEDNLPSPVEIGLSNLPNIGGAIGPPAPFVPSSLLGMYVIMYVGQDTINQKGKKCCF